MRRGWDVSVAATAIDERLRASAEMRHHVRFKVIRIPTFSHCSRRQRIRYLSSWLRLLLHNPKLAVGRTSRGWAFRAVCLTQIIDAVKPDIIHAHFGPNAAIASMAVGDAGIPVIADFHGYDATVTPTLIGWRMYSRLLAPVKFALAHSGFIENIISDHIDAPVVRTCIGVDTGKFAPRSNYNNTWHEHVRLISVGRLVPQKGHCILLRALAALNADAPDLHFSLTIVGEGPQALEIESTCRSLQLSEAVSLTGAVRPDKVAEELAKADIAVFPSQISEHGGEEAFCRSAVEAMATGLPVVATPTGGLRETVSRGGIMAAGVDSTSIASAIQEVLRRAGPRQWSQYARQQAMKFQLEHMMADYECVTIEASGLAPERGRRCEI